MKKKEFEEIFERYNERTERYIGALKEDFDDQLQAIFEYAKNIPTIKTKLDATFKKVGDIAIDVEMVKETV